MAENKLQTLLSLVGADSRCAIFTHANPDPDTLASAAALRYILMKTFGRRPPIIYDGIVGRAENRKMVELTEIPLVHRRDAEPAKYDFRVIVDCQPNSGNAPAGVGSYAAVIDHHPKRADTDARFVDIRDNIGATATILTGYLAESGFEIPRKLATALFYAIGSETQDLGRDASRADIEAYQFLFPAVDNRALSRIKFPDLDRDFFRILSRALNNAKLYDDVMLVNLGELADPDMVPAVADALVRFRGAAFTLAFGKVGPKLHLSLRIDHKRDEPPNEPVDAGALLIKAVGKDGTAGGHAMMAGGAVVVDGFSRVALGNLYRRIRRRLFRLLKVKAKRGVKILADKTVLP